jgi:predicted pyridoxine 5'-phosphate oxidase superfamily flavin-nucleotide-binding protein
MSIRLTEDMKQFVLAQRLGYHATVNPDGSPNLSPKGNDGRV